MSKHTPRRYWEKDPDQLCPRCHEPISVLFQKDGDGEGNDLVLSEHCPVCRWRTDFDWDHGGREQ